MDQKIYYNYPLPEDYLQQIRSTPMGHQYSSSSFGSTGSYITPSPTLVNGHDFQQPWSHVQSRHNSTIYATSPNSYYPAPVVLPSSRHDQPRHESEKARNVKKEAQDRCYDDYDDSNSRHGSASGHRHQGRNSSEEKDSAKRVLCPYPDCSSSFSRKADVARHIKSTHQVEYIDCPMYRCVRTGKNGFARQDHLVEHLRGYHNDNTIPKRQTSTGKEGRSRHKR